MPTYNYECKKCAEQLEVFQRITADPLTTCPKCNKDELKKIIVASGGFQLKGKGWFKSGGY
ncbi:MAG: FmdB family zinc ribbon protein [Methylophagaceae bacterium]|jgi:putative FmdB family regulatory protein|tara:strand:+ start:330 stop:512 length:183 start_codon:yes stop_codon:yes gene_type:complete